MDFIDLSEYVVCDCGSYINCDLFLLDQIQNNSCYLASQSDVVNLRSDFTAVSVAVDNQSVKYGL
jgi:hypothetical protein